MLIFLSADSIAQTNSTGFVQQTGSRPLGNHAWTLIWGTFTTPTLPSGAVITGIYPVMVANGVRDQAGSACITSGISLSLTNDCFHNGDNLASAVPYINPWSTFSSSEFYGNSIGTSYSALTNYNILSELYSTLSTDNMKDIINTESVGFAVYYTAPSPRVQGVINPPFPIPHGSGLAWSLPTSATTSPPAGGGFSGYTLGSPNPAGYVSMLGTIQLPNASDFNGTFTIRMPKVGVQNTCNAPFITVPTSTVTLPINNGTVVGLSNGVYSSQDCLKPLVPYYVQILDAKNNVVSSDNWYLPDNYSGMVDIGQMQEQKFNGPIMVSIPQGIISTPATNQTITQPAGTSLTINGTVNFTGTVNYTTPPAFTLVKANQVLVNGVASSSYPLDVNGIINSSAGFCVAGCSGATVGQGLIYNGTAFVPGNFTVVFPNQYYQTIATMPQRAAIAFDTVNSFVLGDSASPSQTTVKLLPVGVAGNYTNVSSMSTDIYGRVLSVGTSTISTIRGTLTIGTIVMGTNTGNIQTVTMSAAVPAGRTVVISPATGSSVLATGVLYEVGAVSGATVTVLFNNPWNSTQSIGPATFNLAVQ